MPRGRYNQITVQNIVNSCQHSQGFFQRALNLKDMHVGAELCVFVQCFSLRIPLHFVVVKQIKHFLCVI